MDPNRPRTPEELALEAEANRRPAERPAVEGTTAPPTEAAANPFEAENAATENPVGDADPTSGALDPTDLFGSFDVGVQGPPDAVVDASVERGSTQSSADNVSTRAEPFVPDAFTPPPINEIVGSLPSASIADVPAAILAKEMVATWQDLPADFDPHRDSANADRRESANDDVPGGDPQPVAASVEVGGSIGPEPVAPPPAANEDVDAFDRTPDSNPPQHIAIDDLLGRPNDPIVIDRGPIRNADDSRRPSINQLSATGGDSSVPERPSDTDLSPRATKLQSPTSDGGPPLARPIFLVSVPDEQTRRILDEALAEAGRRDAKTAAEIAQQQVDDAFWLRACEERALYRGR